METIKKTCLNDVIPFRAIHPGEILGDELKERGLKQKDFAKQIGMQQTHLSELIKGKRNVTKDIAARLEDELGIPYSQWMSLQNDYDYNIRIIDRRNAENAEAARKEAAISEQVNIKELYKRLKIASKSVCERISQLYERLHYDPLDTARLESQTMGLFRRSDKLSTDKKNMRTWILLAHSSAKEAEVSGKYKKGNAVNAAKTIADKANKQTLNIESIRECLDANGIAYVEIPKLDQTPIDAYSMMCDDKPAIAVTYRHNDIDKLAFDILHELCHIDRHIENGCSFISMDGSIYSDSPIEQEANKFAQDMLIPQDVWNSILSTGSKCLNPHLLAEIVAREAAKRGISKTIAVARYKHDTNAYNIRSCRSPKIFKNNIVPE